MKRCFLYPGQGAQFPGMGKDLYDAYPEARELFKAATEAAGFDVIMVETVGVGQSEVEVAGLADSTVVVLAPGLGDGIQAAKAGILETADVLVVNKSDRDGANQVVRDLTAMLRLGDTAGSARPPRIAGLILAACGVDDDSAATDAIADPAAYAAFLEAANAGVQDRGGAKPGDKTIIDAIHPAAGAFAAAVAADEAVAAAGAKALAAAEAGRDRVTPLRSKIGRAGWVGERTEGKVDPGCALFTLVLDAVVNG